MAIQQRSKIKGFGQSANEKHLVLDVNDVVTELNNLPAPTWGDITGNMLNQIDLQTVLFTKQPYLVSGTNIKTVKGQSLVGPGNVDITAATVGLSMVNNTSDVNKPISTATQTALNAKQATLVSGTNIKTINGSSVLGSGNLTSGGICSVIPLASGQYTYIQAAAGPPSNATAYSNSIFLQPYIPAHSYTCDIIILHVNTGQSGGLGKIGIYDHVNGLPENLLYESADVDCSTVGVKSITTSFDFVAGEMYWIASNFNVVQINIKQVNTYARIPINTLGYAASPSNSLRKLQTFGSFPNPIGGDVYPYPFETLPYLAFRKQ
jgi:hypothetical protein